MNCCLAIALLNRKFYHCLCGHFASPPPLTHRETPAPALGMDGRLRSWAEVDILRSKGLHTSRGSAGRWQVESDLFIMRELDLFILYSNFKLFVANKFVFI